MPHINSDGTITIPADIVKNMGGIPGEEIVFEEWLRGFPEEGKEETIELSVMRRSVWEQELENRAEELR